MYGVSSFHADLREIRDLTRQIRGCLEAQSMSQSTAGADGGLVGEVVQNFQLVQRGLLESKSELEKDCADQIQESEVQVKAARDKLDHACKHRDLYAELQANCQKLVECKPQITKAMRARNFEDAKQVLDRVYKVSIVPKMIDRGEDVSDVVGKLNGCADAKKVVKEIAAIKEKLRKLDAIIPGNCTECEQRLEVVNDRIASLEGRLESVQSRHTTKVKRLNSRLEKASKRHEKEMRQTQYEMQRVSVQAQGHERYMQILNEMM